MFVLNSDVKIGGFRFSGVHEVEINKSMHSIVETATIKVPSIARVSRNGKGEAETVTTANLFKEGDEVEIWLGYNGDLQPEFRGFVKSCSMGMPLVIDCEGYSWLLRRNEVMEGEASATVKALLEKAVSGIEDKYKVKVICDVSLELNQVIQGKDNGFAIIDKISKAIDESLTIFFVDHDTLWCGYIYTPCAKGTDPFHKGTVSYRPGYNILKDNNLKVRAVNANPVEVKYSKKLSKGSIVAGTSDVYLKMPKKYSKLLNQVVTTGRLKELADEKAYNMNYAGYEGSLTTFLQPYAAPGYAAYVQDDRYPERNGFYLVESTKVSFGISGARRITEIGPKIEQQK